MVISSWMMAWVITVLAALKLAAIFVLRVFALWISGRGFVGDDPAGSVDQGQLL